MEKAQVREQDGLSVTAIVLEDEEAEKIYGVNLGGMGIRAIWLRIQNNTDQALHLLPTSLDLDYFSQNEAAYRFHSAFKPDQNQRISEHFHSLAIRKDLAAGKTTEGYVLVNRHRGGRYLIVELMGDSSLKRFDFMFTLPDGTFDFESVDFEQLASEQDLDLASLKAWAESLPCCTMNEKGDAFGDPVNLILVGDANYLLGALTRSGWAFTEKVAPKAVWETVKSTLLGAPEWNFPVSPLYLFGRHQDFAMQRPRGSIPQRNHMRVWQTPVKFNGTTVWAAQLSRDIGVKPTWHSPFLFTHVIDAEVDEDRSYLLEILMRSQSVEAYGYVGGVGAATIEAPKHNLTNDPYRTDGRRLMLIVAKDPVPIHEVRVIR